MLDSTGIAIGDLIGVFYLNDGILLVEVMWFMTAPTLQIAVVGDDLTLLR